MNFKHSDSIKAILPALVKVQQQMPQLAKDKKNPHAKSKYLTLDSILGALTPLLNKEGVFLSQIPVEDQSDKGQSIGVDTLLWHQSGEYIMYPAVLYQFEKGGRMNLTQSVGSIITYAKRYALTSIFGISTNEDADGVQPNVEPQQTERDRKWEQFTKDRDQLFNRVQQLATDTMQSTNKVSEVIMERTSEEIGNEQQDITPENIAIFNKQLRLAETKFKASQNKQQSSKDSQQQSILKGNTTEPVGGNADEQK